MSRRVRQNKTPRENDRLRKLPENMTNRQFDMPMTVTFPANCVGLPDRLIVILKYSQQYSFAGGTATPSAQVWALNSAFDPDYSGTGHQPSFWDKIAAVYGRYFVRRFKVEVELINTTAAVGVTVACCYSDQNISSNTVEELVEAKYSKWLTLSLPTGNAAVKRISMPWMSSMKLMGQPYTEADDSMYATVSASPTDIAWGILKAAASDGLTVMTMNARVSLYQEIIMKDLLTQSTS